MGHQVGIFPAVIQAQDLQPKITKSHSLRRIKGISDSRHWALALLSQ